jgi:hypothetical protein
MKTLLGYAAFVLVLGIVTVLVSNSNTSNAIECKKAGLVWTAPHWYDFTGECK